MSRFYIATSTAWQNSKWAPVAGPFATRAEAEEIRPQHEAGQPGDLMSAVYAKVVSRTELARMTDAYPMTPDGESDLLEELYHASKPAHAKAAAVRIMAWDTEDIADLCDAIGDLQDSEYEDADQLVDWTSIPSAVTDLDAAYNDPVWACDQRGNCLVGDFSATTRRGNSGRWPIEHIDDIRAAQAR